MESSTVLANDKQEAQETLLDAYRRFSPERIAISFSGAEDVVLIDLATRVMGGSVQVFTLDTGRLHAETYQYIEKVRDHYGLDIEVLSPEHEALEEFVQTKGLFSFYRDGHFECCGVRKISTLQRKLEHLDAWITGQRRDQGVTRTDVPYEQIDETFSVPDHTLVKFNPIADWSSTDVWNYIREHDVPYNVLHDRGYKSIGCEPCTRPIADDEPERAGRWWWENEEDKECGLHIQNVTLGTEASK